MIETQSEPWLLGQLATTLLAVDPKGLGGVHIQARADPVRDKLLTDLPVGLRDARRITPSVSDINLFGGMDLTQTLSTGRMCLQTGILDDARCVLMAMAERCSPDLAARLCQRLDRGDGPCLILLDESCDDDEAVPVSLRDRVAFSFSLEGLRALDLPDLVVDDAMIRAAQDRLAQLELPETAICVLTETATHFGISSLRAPWLALLVARANAALSGRESIGSDDLEIAAQLVFAPRATVFPEPADVPDDTPDSPSDAPVDGGDTSQMEALQDMLVEAIKAQLPHDLLTSSRKHRRTSKALGSAGAGFKRRGNRRGRPLPSRPGQIASQNRVDFAATLRAAAPWQMMRQGSGTHGFAIRTSDIHIRRFEEKSDRLVIFVVDASGSSAVSRLAEAKGAVELMLGDAYQRRDHVALISFRGTEADLVLPPTRSLVLTKHRLSGIPGGGGTPLATGLKLAHGVAHSAISQGLSPAIAVLTDGRANIALDGTPGRRQAADDADAMAKRVRAMDLASVVLDISNRPSGALHGLALAMGADYVPLPRANAHQLNRSISAALDRN